MTFTLLTHLRLSKVIFLYMHAGILGDITVTVIPEINAWLKNANGVNL